MTYRAAKATIKHDGVTIARCVERGARAIVNEDRATMLARMLNEHSVLFRNATRAEIVLEQVVKGAEGAIDEARNLLKAWEK